MRKKLIALALMSIFASFGVNIALADSISVTTTVSSFITATYQYSAVDFGTVSAGSTDNPANENDGQANVTISTNKEFQLAVSGSDLTGSTSSFGIGNLTMDMNTTQGNLAVGSSIAVGTSPVVIGVEQDENVVIMYEGYWIDIPAGQYAEAYSTTLTETYSNV